RPCARTAAQRWRSAAWWCSRSTGVSRSSRTRGSCFFLLTRTETGPILESESARRGALLEDASGRTTFAAHGVGASCSARTVRRAAQGPNGPDRIEKTTTRALRGARGRKGPKKQHRAREVSSRALFHWSLEVPRLPPRHGDGDAQRALLGL